jgi:hypothetical protein
VQRIVIVGASGAGKTVLARKLGALLDLPVIHLDPLRYDKDWNTTPEPDFVAAQQQLAARPKWIADGTSLASLPIRAAAADTIIVLDPHPIICLTGLLTRRWRYHGGQHPDGVFDRLNARVVRYAGGFRRHHLPRVLDCVREHGRHATVLHLTSRAGTRHLLDRLAAEHPGRPR